MRLVAAMLLAVVSAAAVFLGAGCVPRKAVTVTIAPKRTDVSQQQPPNPVRPRGTFLGRPLNRRVPAPISAGTGISYHRGRIPYVTFVFDREAKSPWLLRTPRGWVRADYDYWRFGHRDEHGELDIPAMGGINTLTIDSPRDLPVLLRFVLGPNDPHNALDRVAPDDNGKPLPLTIQKTRRTVYGSAWLSGGYHVIQWETSV